METRLVRTTSAWVMGLSESVDVGCALAAATPCCGGWSSAVSSAHWQWD